MKLYKFRDLDSGFEFTEKIISKGEVYFCPPLKLNDPHELATTYDFACEDQGKIDFWMSRDAQRKVLAGIPTNESKLRYISDIEREAQKARLEFFHRDTSIGILSLAQDWRNLVLWSHYSKAHTGVCIEFETEADPLLKKAEIVQYTPNVTAISFYRTDLITAVKQALYFKFEDWRYESEWRVWRNPSGVHSLNPDCITGVYFGMNADVSRGRQRDLYELIRAKHPHIPTYKVIRDRTTFQLRADSLTAPPLPVFKMPKEEAIEILELFVLKVDEIEQESCWAFYKRTGLKTAMKFSDELEITYENEFPPTESIKAFLLTYRMFIQKNDKIGLPNIHEALLSLDPRTNPVVSKCRDLMADLLSQPYMPGIPTIEILMEAFIYGNFAHSSKGPERNYKKIKIDDEGMKHHHFHFIGHLMDITQTVLFPLRDEALKVLSSIK